jgi:hypothetical protein
LLILDEGRLVYDGPLQGALQDAHLLEKHGLETDLKGERALSLILFARISLSFSSSKSSTIVPSMSKGSDLQTIPKSVPGGLQCEVGSDIDIGVGQVVFLSTTPALTAIGHHLVRIQSQLPPMR